MPGNFGELALDQSNTGASYISNWISNGVSKDDLADDVAAGVLPLSQDTSPTPDWAGNPGLKTSTIWTTENYVGQTYLLPLFRPVNPDPNNYIAGTGNGTNSYYRIVQFVGIKIINASDKAIVVQPAAVLCPNALLTGVAPAAPPPAGGLPITTFATPKRSR
jgi:hypothetical protein